MPRHTIKFKNNFEDTLLGYAWTCAEPKANVMIFTGMQETAIRYDEFAKFLNENGFDVYCLDHYGQGLNVKEGEIPGKWPISGFSKMSKTFGDLAYKLEATSLPTYVFAHSMGSFIAQDYIQRYHDKITKVVLCGSDYASPSKMSMAYHLAKLLAPKKRRDFMNKKLAKLVTGSFAKSVQGARTSFDWLSHNDKNIDEYIADPLCGFVATGGFYLEFLKGMRRIAKKRFLKKIDKDISILVIAGAEDPVGHLGKGPVKLANKYFDLGIQDVTLKIYKHMRHELLNEIGNEEVYKDVLEFFNK